MNTKTKKRVTHQNMRFDQHSLYEDSEDEKRLNELPETEKEKILYERHLQLQKLNEKKEMDAKMRERESSTLKEKESPQMKKEIKKQENEDFTFDEMNKIVIKRDDLINNIYRPCFDRCIGQWVRVRFETGYALREILDIERGKAYSAQNQEGRKARSDKYIKVQKTPEKYEILPVFNVSNSKLELVEFDYFKKKKPNFPLKRVRTQSEKFKALLKKPVTVDEKALITEERNKFNEMPYQRIWEKVRLIREQDDAFKNGDKAKYLKLHHQIAKMDEEEKDPAEEAERKIWAKINKRNRQINYEKGIGLDPSNKEKEKTADFSNKRRR